MEKKKLHLLYQTKYTASLQINKKTILTGDESFIAKAIFKGDLKNNFSMKVTLKCHSKLINYHQNQYIFINCIMFKKYPKFETQLIGRDCIELPKSKFHISWVKKKNIKLKQPLLPQIEFRIRVAVKPDPTKENIQFIPTFKEIAKEISKLSDQEIEQEREEYNDYLKNGDSWLIFETLQQRIANSLIKQKERKYKMALSLPKLNKKNQIKQKKLIHDNQRHNTNIKKC